mmetsp:Transcript_10009/g.19535  ORF Transcript_10009/g.19535 Transcript_10009/m.19535 type:complete len:615 (+) Transcript_10009:184-2028(+)
MSEWKDEDNISRYKLEAALKKAFPHSKDNIHYLVSSLSYDTENSISLSEFWDNIGRKSKTHPAGNRRKVIESLAKFQCGSEDQLPFIETETTNAYIFQWNTTAEGAENARKILMEEKIGAFHLEGPERKDDTENKRDREKQEEERKKHIGESTDERDNERKKKAQRSEDKVTGAHANAGDESEDRIQSGSGSKELKDEEGDEDIQSKQKAFGVVSIFELKTASPQPIDYIENERKQKRKEDAEEEKEKGFMSSYVLQFKEYAEAGKRPLFEIHAEIEAGMHMTFNYMINLYGGAAIAAVGLSINSASIVVASMLISPLMNPLLAIVFGAAVHDWRMFRIGLFNETKSMFHCIFMGFLMGLILTPLRAADQNWPTDEMKSRGDLLSLSAATIFAIASGLVVGVNVSDSGFNALVGVAISASLLPPVVLTGMALAFAAVAPSIYPTGVIDTTPETQDTTSIHLVVDTDNYIVSGWSTEYRADVASMLRIGYISLAIYLVNCVVIVIVCLLVFRLKSYSATKAIDLGWHRHDSLFHRMEKFKKYFRKHGIGSRIVSRMYSEAAEATAVERRECDEDPRNDVEGKIPSDVDMEAALEATISQGSSKQQADPPPGCVSM